MIAQAIGRAFQEAYFQYLRENGVEDPEAYQERDYQNVVNSQEIFRNELSFFADKDQEKEVRPTPPPPILLLLTCLSALDLMMVCCVSKSSLEELTR